MSKLYQCINDDVGFSITNKGRLSVGKVYYGTPIRMDKTDRLMIKDDKGDDTPWYNYRFIEVQTNEVCDE